jgi:hypothetical protein
MRLKNINSGVKFRFVDEKSRLRLRGAESATFSALGEFIYETVCEGTAPRLKDLITKDSIIFGSETFEREIEIVTEGNKGRPRSGQQYNEHPLYVTWCMIKQRCCNPRHTAYKYYGGRGITICSEWINDFGRFVKDVGDRPSDGYSLDRYPNKNGNYEPGNVRWATDLEQAQNRNPKNSIYHPVS